MISHPSDLTPLARAAGALPALAGDFTEADESLAHRPTALPGEPCICLIATTGHLRARGLLGWLVRPLLGM